VTMKEDDDVTSTDTLSFSPELADDTHARILASDERSNKAERGKSKAMDLIASDDRETKDTKKDKSKRPSPRKGDIGSDRNLLQTISQAEEEEISDVKRKTDTEYTADYAMFTPDCVDAAQSDAAQIIRSISSVRTSSSKKQHSSIEQASADKVYCISIQEDIHGIRRTSTCSDGSNVEMMEDIAYEDLASCCDNGSSNIEDNPRGVRMDDILISSKLTAKEGTQQWGDNKRPALMQNCLPIALERDASVLPCQEPILSQIGHEMVASSSEALKKTSSKLPNGPCKSGPLSVAEDASVMGCNEPDEDGGVSDCPDITQAVIQSRVKLPPSTDYTASKSKCSSRSKVRPIVSIARQGQPQETEDDASVVFIEEPVEEETSDYGDPGSCCSSEVLESAAMHHYSIEPHDAPNVKGTQLEPRNEEKTRFVEASSAKGLDKRSKRRSLRRGSSRRLRFSVRTTSTGSTTVFTDSNSTSASSGQYTYVVSGGDASTMDPSSTAAVVAARPGAFAIEGMHSSMLVSYAYQEDDGNSSTGAVDDHGRQGRRRTRGELEDSESEDDDDDDDEEQEHAMVAVGAFVADADIDGDVTDDDQREPQPSNNCLHLLSNKHVAEAKSVPNLLCVVCGIVVTRPLTIGIAGTFVICCIIVTIVVVTLNNKSIALRTEAEQAARASADATISRRRAIRSLIVPHVSSDTDVSQHESAQNVSLTWLLGEANDHLHPVHNASRLVQRYVLSAFLVSGMGETSYEFLFRDAGLRSRESECVWMLSGSLGISGGEGSNHYAAHLDNGGAQSAENGNGDPSHNHILCDNDYRHVVELDFGK
jgi:hypothetical protein